LTRRRWGRGLLCVMHGLRSMIAEGGRLELSSSIFTDERFHQSVFKTPREVADLMRMANRTVIVSCYAPKQFEFDRDLDVSYVTIPPHTRTRAFAAAAYTGGDRVLPELIDEIAADLYERVDKGVLVLVAAGFAGKWLLHTAKMAGGVGLDVGSALDYWLGLKTRRYIDIV